MTHYPQPHFSARHPLWLVLATVARRPALRQWLSGLVLAGGLWGGALPSQAQGLEAPLVPPPTFSDGTTFADRVERSRQGRPDAGDYGEPETTAETTIVIPTARPQPSMGCPSSVSDSSLQPPFAACLPEPYQLSRGDRIFIDVFDAPEYTGEYELFSDGTISLPIAGQFFLQGLTLAEAEILISQGLADILRRPIVTLRLLEERPLNLAVTGQVHRPGAYTLSLDDVDGIPTVTKAIQLARGIRLTADIRNVKVLRMNPRTALVDEIAVVNLWALLEYGDLTQDIALQDGDSIVIPEVAEINYDEVNVLAYANLSPEEMTVNVVGEVAAPGAIQVKPNTPLHQALLAAGGFTNRARRKRVMLIRLNPDGTVTNQTIDVDFSQPIDEFNNPPLRPYDTVVVGRSTFTKVTDVLDRALSSVARIVSVLALFGL